MLVLHPWLKYILQGRAEHAKDFVVAGPWRGLRRGAWSQGRGCWHGACTGGKTGRGFGLQQKVRHRHFVVNFCKVSAHDPTSTALLSCFDSIMPPKRKPTTPSSRKRTPKKGRKVGPSRDVHYPGGGLQTSFPVEGVLSLVAYKSAKPEILAVPPVG